MDTGTIPHDDFAASLVPRNDISAGILVAESNKFQDRKLTF